MKKWILGITLLFSSVVMADLAVQPVASQLKPRMPEWHPKIVDRYENGAAKMVLYLEDQDEGEPIAVKRIYYYENGKMSEEIDLIHVSEDSEAAKEWESIDVPHGLRVYYNDQGRIGKVACYDHGVLHGPFKSFREDGKLQQEISFKQGKRFGEAMTYHEDGNVAEKAFFEDDKAVGEIAQYYPSGNRKTLVPYKDGVVSGKVQKWFEEGSLESEEHYVKGKLHSVENIPAHVVYDDLGSISQINHYKEGLPHGLHTSYHPNGQQRERVEYTDGKMDGKCDLFSTKGELIGEGKYKKGVPYGKHYRNFESGELAYIAKFGDEGELLEPILEYNEEGTCTARYEVNQENKRHGVFQKWYDDGTLHQDFFYVNGEFDQKQSEFFANGSPHRVANYENCKKHGSFVEFTEEGQLILDLTFHDGMIDGVAKEWYNDGTLKVEKGYEKGIPVGKHCEWFEDGEPSLVAHYVAGELDGEHTLFNKKHAKVYAAHYEKGKLEGDCCNYHEDGALKEKMTFKDNKRVGEYTFYYPSSQLQTKAFYKDDQLDGEMIGYFENGQVAFERNFKEGKFVGAQTEYFSMVGGEKMVAKVFHYNDEGNYDGEQKTFYESGVPQTLLTYHDGKMHGMKAFWGEDGEMLEEAWYENDQLEGRFFERDPSGKEVIAFYEGNKKEGPYEVFYPDHPEFGKVKALEATYKDNHLVGEMVEYNEKGEKMAVSRYENGKKNGVSQLYFNNEALVWECPFKDDLRHGLCKEYFESGKVHKESNYELDQQVGEEKVYYENGQIASLSVLKEGKLDGLVQNWTPEGTLIFEGEYLNGERHGKFNKFYDDGSPRLVQSYVHDQLDGVKKVYDKEGQVTESTYKTGQLVL